MLLVMARVSSTKSERNSKDCAGFLRAMGDDTRLRILQSLLHCERCVNDIAHTLKLPQPHVSHHLQILKNAGLVEGRRDGQRICYRLLPEIGESVSGQKVTAIDLGCCRISFR